MYVVDASVGFKWLVPEVDSDKALRVRDEFDRGLLDLIAPDVFAIEVIHSLTRGERQGRITPARGAFLLNDLLSGLPGFHASLPLLPRAYEISSQARIGVYDCLYVALAEREGCEFLTADGRLVRALQPTFPFILALSSLP